MNRQKILLIRPCAGVEHDLHRTLSSFPACARGASSFDVRVRFAIASEDDPAAPLVRAAIASLELDFAPESFDVSVVVTHATGPNHKADQLARVLERECSWAPDVVVIADSDVDLTTLDFGAFLAPLRGADTREHVAPAAAVWAPPIEIAPLTLGDRASAAVLDSSMHAFPLLGALDKKGMVGKLVAIRRSTLEAIGGFEALRSYLGEDMELASRLVQTGQRIVRSHEVAHSRVRGRALRAVLHRYVRWLMVIRAQRPHLLPSYPLFLCVAPLLLLASVMLKLGTVAIGVIVARLTIGFVARWRSRSTRSLLTLPVDAVMSDLLLLAAFAIVVTTRSPTFSWRGRTLRISRDGRLSEDSSDPHRVSQMRTACATRNKRPSRGEASFIIRSKSAGQSS